jgi:hypothetical protein
MFSEAFYRVSHQRNSSSAASSRFNSASSPAPSVALKELCAVAKFHQVYATSDL